MEAISITRPGRAALVAALCALLVACGGGDDGAPGAPTPPPVTPGPEIPPAPPPPAPPPPPPPPPPPGASSSACSDMGALLAAINAARAQARVCRSGGPAMPAVAALAWNSQLAAAADRHSRDMAENDRFSHTGLDGSSPAQRVTAAGYNYWATGENIAAGYRSVSTVVQGWLDSPGHCENIMNASYQDFGAACRYKADSYYEYYWTTNFGRPR